ncbi:MAG: monofunctional biosynthetic peptidoglycan transglycosylase [Calditrichaeota bacterium]|nr:monofunctional biosynthetic peptidoglycan transglycosylase [Calditrichota bacterium]MCB0307184.1 monofunctional biosynthetic peptidoglycan transglycosylase [Calditrichota bacterium]
MKDKVGIGRDRSLLYPLQNMSITFRTFAHLWVAVNCLLAGLLGYTWLSVPDVAPLTAENPSTTAFIEFRKAEATAAGKTLVVRQQWVALNAVPQLLQRTIIVAEDASFWVHEGVDWYEMEEAIRDNINEGKRLRGASTITQQTAKNLFLSPERSLYRKFREFLITQELEAHLSKNRILELYLNYIEFGEGLFGIGSAARHYFGKSPAELDLFEMVRLAAIIPNPLNLDPRRPSGDLRWRCRVILQRVRHYKWASEDEYQAARSRMDAFFGR